MNRNTCLTLACRTVTLMTVTLMSIAAWQSQTSTRGMVIIPAAKYTFRVGETSREGARKGHVQRAGHALVSGARGIPNFVHVFGEKVGGQEEVHDGARRLRIA